MSQDQITVCTATLGHSAGHLNRQMIDLRALTALPFRQVVSDDGTADPTLQDMQRDVCRTHGAEWTENPGPTYGISYNWNHLLEQVRTPWAFCVEDGLRPGKGWLESAEDTIYRLGNRSWLGHSVGMIGTTSFEDWHLAMAGVLPTKRPFIDFIHRSDAETYSAFWGGEQWPNWNDGLWCWKRLLPKIYEVCTSPEADTWSDTCRGYFRDVVRGQDPEPYKSELGRCPSHAWPSVRTAACGWFPGAFMLVNMEAWRAVGKFRDGCTFFEGHLGIRMALGGFLSLALNFPPWLHYAGMGFVCGPNIGKKPRHHEPCDGPYGLLERDFGCNGEGHVELYNLVQERFPAALQNEINARLAEEPIYMDPAWERWL